MSYSCWEWEVTLCFALSIYLCFPGFSCTKFSVSSDSFFAFQHPRPMTSSGTDRGAAGTGAEGQHRLRRATNSSVPPPGGHPATKERGKNGPLPKNCRPPLLSLFLSEPAIFSFPFRAQFECLCCNCVTCLPMTHSISKKKLNILQLLALLMVFSTYLQTFIAWSVTWSLAEKWVSVIINA